MINVENKTVNKKMALRFWLLEIFIVRLLDLNHHIKRYLYPRIDEE
jgi:hypothetical protein